MATENELKEYLANAANGSRKDGDLFFRTLLNFEVYVPCMLSGSEQKHVLSPSGEKYFSLDHEGRRVVPIFTSTELLESWMPQGCSVAKHEFLTLLQLIDDSSWLHLNPNDEAGKEFSPWELSILRDHKEEGIQEILDDVMEDEEIEVEINYEPQAYGEIKKRISAIAESYSGVKECFIIECSQDGTNFPVFGYKQTGLTEEKLALFRDEVKSVFEESAQVEQDVLIADDLDNPHGFHSAWFANAVPFYYAGPPQTKPSSIFSQVMEGIRKLR